MWAIKLPLTYLSKTVILCAVLLLVAACAPAASDSAQQAAAQQAAAQQTAAQPTEALPTATVTAAPEVTTTLDATVTSQPTATLAPTAAPTTTASPTAEEDDGVPADIRRSFSTDFSNRSISFDEILSGGPPKDGIRSIDNPKFETIRDAGEWLQDLEPVIVFESEEQVRIYPFQILTWHEIVNDVIDRRPVTITFCPLCNTAIAFDARVDGTNLDFGTTGRLRYSNLLMYDRQTESWWQQATGEAVMGEFTGQRLRTLPVSIISWAEARERFPRALVLSQDTGFFRNYGQNPYAGYDNINSSPFLYDGPTTPDELPPMARVTTVALGEEAVAYPEEALQQAVVVNDTVGGVDIVVFWHAGLASALDTSALAEGRDVGATGVFRRTLNEQTLTFYAAGGAIYDNQTGSTWNLVGEAEAGPLMGERLSPVVKIDHFWFSWAAFQPDTRIYQP